MFRAMHSSYIYQRMTAGTPVPSVRHPKETQEQEMAQIFDYCWKYSHNRYLAN